MFRRLSMRAGDRTKTSRERHVASKLYAFFVFNNLIVFSVFGAVWKFVSEVVGSTVEGVDAWTAIEDADFASALFVALCSISSFWITWLLQRNLGAAVDLVQLWPLFWSFCVRKFSSPTPRELIELTAPPAFDYASYYNYFLFYCTVALAFGTIQPLVLVAAALYFCVDVYLKKYLLLYIFITKTESGGMFWRVVFNRILFATFFANLIVLLVTIVRGDGEHMESYALIPLPILLTIFKFYCKHAFDNKIHYFTTGSVMKDSEARPFDPMSKVHGTKNDRLGVRFGHPALYKPLLTPMVHSRAQNILASIYRGRLTDGSGGGSNDASSVSGYSDTFALDQMRPGQPGRSATSKQPLAGFEVVPESQLDFSYYKNRQEFGEEHGGAGQIYGRAEDLVSERPDTPQSFLGGRHGYGSPGSSRAGSPAPGMGSRTLTGTTYPAGYTAPTSYEQGDISTGRSGLYAHDNTSESRLGLVGGAAEMSVATPGLGSSSRRDESMDRAPGFLGGGPMGYGGLPQQDEEHDPTSYDYFRRGRS